MGRRGNKKHLKRLAVPKHWMLDKLGGTWAPRPSTGPHRLRECLPLVLILRNRLKYALTRREAQIIVMQKYVKVDGQVRRSLSSSLRREGPLHPAEIGREGAQVQAL